MGGQPLSKCAEFRTPQAIVVLISSSLRRGGVYPSRGRGETPPLRQIVHTIMNSAPVSQAAALHLADVCMLDHLQAKRSAGACAVVLTACAVVLTASAMVLAVRSSHHLRVRFSL